MAPLANDALRRQVDAMIGQIRDLPEARRAALRYTQSLARCARCRFGAAAGPICDLLSASCNQLNTEFGFAWCVAAGAGAGTFPTIWR